MNQLSEKKRNTRVRRKIGWLGIDVGSRAVKLAQVEQSDGAWQLRVARVVSVPEGADALGIAIEAVQEILGEKARLFGQPVACVMSVHTEMRNIDLPQLSIPELHHHVATQMGPAQATRLFSFWPSSLLPGQKEEQPYHLLMVERQQATEFAEQLLRGGAECEALDTQPSCLARAARMIQPNSSAIVAVVDWAYNTPLLTVARNGQPYFSRHLRDCGFRNLLASVASSTNLSEDEVALLLRRLSAAESDASELHNTSRVVQRAVATHVRHFAEELERTICFLGTEGRDAIPEQIYLVGGGACVPGAVREFSERTDIPTSAWKLPQPQSETGNAGDSSNSALFASAIALSAMPLL